MERSEGGAKMVYGLLRATAAYVAAEVWVPRLDRWTLAGPLLDQDWRVVARKS